VERSGRFVPAETFLQFFAEVATDDELHDQVRNLQELIIVFPGIGLMAVDVFQVVVVVLLYVESFVLYFPA